MNGFITILAFIFVLGLIILVHEGGHFLFARRVNILCREFAFGMGPILLKKKKGETLYSLRAFPIGGFCAIAGEEYEDDPLKDKERVRLQIIDGVVKKIYLDDDESFRDIPAYKVLEYDLFDVAQTGRLFMVLETTNGPQEYRVDPQALLVTKKQAVQIAPFNRTLGAKRKRDRALVIFGGPLMNFILAILVFFLAGLLEGFPDYQSTALYQMSENTPAYYAGLREGDQITHLTSGNLSADINEWNDITIFMNQYTEQYPSDVIEVTFLSHDVSQIESVRPQVFINTIGLQSKIDVDDVIIGPLDERSEAYKAGLRENQTILEINDTEVNNWKAVYDVFKNNIEGNEVTLTVMDDLGQGKTITVKPYSKELMDSQMTIGGDPIPLTKVAMGISPTHTFDLWQSITNAGKMTVSSFGLIINSLRMLFTSKEVGINDLGSFISIYEITGSVARLGFAPLLQWIGMLSVNIGLLNLLPIPALDGGRLVFLGYEAITKKKPNQKVETVLITVTMLLLFALMIYVTFHEIITKIGG